MPIQRDTENSGKPEVVPAQLPRVLGLPESVCVVVGTVVGSSILVVPSLVAREVPFFGAVLVVWALGGLISMAGALTLAELGASLPRAGGAYAYLREAYGSAPAFLFAWTDLLVIKAGAMAATAIGFTIYFAQVIPAPPGIAPDFWRTGIAITVMILIAALNILGTELGGRVQLIGTTLKIAGLGVLIVLPLLVQGKADAADLGQVWPARIDASFARGLLAALVTVLWAYGGWELLGHLGEEIRDPGRNIPRALIVGMVLVMGVYVAMTLVLHLVMPLPELMRSEAVGADYCRHLIGPPGRLVVSLIIMLSSLIAINSIMLAGPRSTFALARDGLFPHWLARLNPHFRTPAAAIVALTAWAIVLTVAGMGRSLLAAALAAVAASPSTVAPRSGPGGIPLYQIVVNYVMFGILLFNLPMIASVFVLRARRPGLLRPYRTFGYPVTPLLNLAATLLLLSALLASNPIESITALVIILLGFPVYRMYTRHSRDHA
jgi:basic amino acid/polyamine antiporter, APA family